MYKDIARGSKNILGIKKTIMSNITADSCPPPTQIVAKSLMASVVPVIARKRVNIITLIAIQSRLTIRIKIGRIGIKVLIA